MKTALHYLEKALNAAADDNEADEIAALISDLYGDPVAAMDTGGGPGGNTDPDED